MLQLLFIFTFEMRPTIIWHKFPEYALSKTLWNRRKSNFHSKRSLISMTRILYFYRLSCSPESLEDIAHENNTAILLRPITIL